MPSMPADVQAAFAQYPEAIREKLLQLRDWIFDVMTTENINCRQETLKWGQPSYLAKYGTTIRLGWDPKTADEYGIYFHCQTTLIETFRSVYGNLFSYTGNRGIRFNMADPVPEEELKQCIAVALQYHRRKTLPKLGLS